MDVLSEERAVELLEEAGWLEQEGETLTDEEIARAKQGEEQIRIQGDVKEVERSLGNRRRDSNEHQIMAEVTWGTEHMFGHHMGQLFPVDGISPIGPLYGRWFASAGRPARSRRHG